MLVRVYFCPRFRHISGHPPRDYLLLQSFRRLRILFHLTAHPLGAIAITTIRLPLHNQQATPLARFHHQPFTDVTLSIPSKPPYLAPHHRLIAELLVTFI